MTDTARTPSSSTVYVVTNDAEEFLDERKCLWNEVLSELYNFAFHSNFDLEWVDIGLHTSKLSMITAECILEKWKQDAGSWIVEIENPEIQFLIGDKYGESSAPGLIRTEEFKSIRNALFEKNEDLKILDDSYRLDRTRKTDFYSLRSQVSSDPKKLATLTEAVQKGAQAAFEDGQINQIHEEQQKRFFISPTEFLVTKVIKSTPNRAIFVMRKFQGTTDAKYIENDESSSKKISELKNYISSKAPKDKVISTIVNIENNEVSSFLKSREADRYFDRFSKQVMDKLKKQLGEMHKTLPEPPSLRDINYEEDLAHRIYAEKINSTKYQPRKIDEKVKDLKPGNVYMLQGPDICGKTRSLCQVYNNIKDGYKVIRFTNLTYQACFAHEFYRGIGLTICELANLPTEELYQTFQLNLIIEKLGELISSITKTIYIFIDDAHLLKFGHFLSDFLDGKHPIPSNLVVLMSASISYPVRPIYSLTSCNNMDRLTIEESVGIMKAKFGDRKLEPELWGEVKKEMSDTKEGILLAECLVNEILLTGNSTFKGGIEGFLARVESNIGVLVVSAVCRNLVLSSHGLTRMEIHDVLTVQKDLLNSFGYSIELPPMVLRRILDELGPLLRVFRVDNRELYSISHVSIINIFRHRYLTSTVEIKSTHSAICDIYTDTYLDGENLSPRSSFTTQIFPQGLKREQACGNIRKLRLLWFHLLHTGNMDALKELTLCQFDYIELTARYFGVIHLISLYEECVMQVLHHDIQVLCEKVLIPSLGTVVKDPEQLATEVIGRLRFTRAENSHFLNTMVEQAMAWVDSYNKGPLLVPLTCWVAPPQTKVCRSFYLKDWSPGQTILAPTQNHQHVLISGNHAAPGVIYMYHIASQLLIATFKGHTNTVTSMCCSNSGQFFVSTSTDKTVRVWSFLTVECIKVLTHHTQKVTCAILTNDDKLLITASADSSAMVIDLETLQVIRSFTEHTGSVVSLQLTSNNEFLITGSGDFVVQMWEVKTGLCIGKMGGLMAPVSCVAITSNDAFVVVACEDETLKVFCTVSGQELHEMLGCDGRVNTLTCAQDDCQVFAGTKSKICCYDVHNGTIIDCLHFDQPYPVCSLKISADNYFLVSACGPKLTIWNVLQRNHEVHDVSTDKDGFLTAIAVSYDEKIAACGTYNGIVALWDLDICQCISTIVQSKNIPVSCVQFSYDNSLLFSGNASGNILIIEAANGNLVKEIFQVHNSEIITIQTLYSGRVISCDKDGKLIGWDTFNDEDPPETLSQGIKPPVFIPPNGKVMLGYVANNNKEMKVWTLSEETLPVQKNRLSHNEEVTCHATCPRGGSLVVTGSRDMSLKVWQFESGFLTQILVGHDNIVTCCAISEDERIVVSGALDQKVIMWSVTTGSAICTVSVTSPVTSVSITGDGSVAFSATKDGWLESWSTEKGKRLSSFNSHRSIRNVIASFEANRLLVQLSGCAQLPILCLHNTPASGQTVTRRQSGRAVSVSSMNNEPMGSSGSMTPEIKRDQPGPSTLKTHSSGNGGPVGSATATPHAPRATFDKLERSKSRTSIIEKDRATTLTTAAPPPTQKSNLCSIL